MLYLTVMSLLKQGRFIDYYINYLDYSAEVCLKAHFAPSVFRDETNDSQ